MFNLNALDEITITKNTEDIIKSAFVLLLIVLFLRTAPFAIAETRCGDDDLGGTIYVDMNGDGKRDKEEPILPTANVSIYDEDGDLLDATLSDSNGKYTFTIRDNEPVWISYGTSQSGQTGTSITNAVGNCSAHLAVAPSANFCPDGATCHSFSTTAKN